MAPHSSTLAWKIPWMEEPGGLQSMGWRRVRHDWATSLSLFTFMHWRRKWQPTPVFLPGESQGRGAWWAAVYGVAQSWTWLKWLSSSMDFPILDTSYEWNHILCSFLYLTWSLWGLPDLGIKLMFPTLPVWATREAPIMSKSDTKSYIVYDSIHMKYPE